jgi:hypothetical protein
MGTKISDLPSTAGVKCPKKTGEMTENESCNDCKEYRACLNALNEFMGW